MTQSGFHIRLKEKPTHQNTLWGMCYKIGTTGFQLRSQKYIFNLSTKTICWKKHFLLYCSIVPADLQKVCHFIFVCCQINFFENLWIGICSLTGWCGCAKRTLNPITLQQDAFLEKPIKRGLFSRIGLPRFILVQFASIFFDAIGQLQVWHWFSQPGNDVYSFNFVVFKEMGLSPILLA